jgi:hypothetical protein
VTNEPIGRRVHGRYVNRAEKLEQEAARRLAFEEVLGATNSPEATSASPMCHFEPLWRVCPAECLGGAGGSCLRELERQSAILRARTARRSPPTMRP